MTEPICAMCYPPRNQDIDGCTRYLCPDHQRVWDDQIAPLLTMPIFQPLPRKQRAPITFAGLSVPPVGGDGA